MFPRTAFLLEREGSSGSLGGPVRAYVTAFLALATVAMSIFCNPYGTIRWSKSCCCRFCSTVRHFCFLHFVLEAEFHYPTALWGLPRAILQYLTAFFAPSKICNTLQHSGTGGREFAIPYCISDTCKNELSRFCNTLQCFRALVFARVPFLQYSPSLLAPSKICNTLQHSGTGAAEFAIPHCISGMSKICG